MKLYELLGGCSSQFPKRAATFWVTNRQFGHLKHLHHIDENSANQNQRRPPQQKSATSFHNSPLKLYCPKGKDGCQTILQGDKLPKIHVLSFELQMMNFQFHLRVMAAGSMLVLGVVSMLFPYTNLCKYCSLRFRVTKHQRGTRGNLLKETLCHVSVESLHLLDSNSISDVFFVSTW